MLTEAIATVESTGERWYEAELYRLKGELTLQQLKIENVKLKITETPHQAANPHAKAEECFLKAIAITQQQQAKSLELRAVMSLVRLRQQQVTQDRSRTTQHEARIRLDEACRMLAEIYNWFTEGFDTKDLQEAKALIEELRH